MKQLKKAGAIEVTSQSIQMKKGRIGIALTAVVKPSDVKKLRLIWFAFGTSIGLRERLEGRWVLNRRSGNCQTSFGKVLVKQVRRPEGKLTIKAEHDELARISLKSGLSIDEVRREVDSASDTFVPNEEWMF